MRVCTVKIPLPARGSAVGVFCLPRNAVKLPLSQFTRHLLSSVESCRFFPRGGGPVSIRFI